MRNLRKAWASAVRPRRSACRAAGKRSEIRVDLAFDAGVELVRAAELVQRILAGIGDPLAGDRPGKHEARSGEEQHGRAPRLEAGDPVLPVLGFFRVGKP